MKLQTLAAACLSLAFGTATLAQSPVKIGIEGAFPPWNALDSQGKLSGLDVDLITDLCKRAALECELVTGPWSGMIPGLNAGKYDAVMTMGINDERRKVIDFTIPYAAGNGTFLVPAGSPLAALPMKGEALNLNDKALADPVMAEIGEKLDGLSVGVVGSTSQERLIAAYFGDHAQVRTYESGKMRDLDLLSGRIDAGFDSGVYAAATYGTDGSGELVMAGPYMRGAMLATNVAIGLRKGEDALREKFDAAIRQAAEDGTIRRVSTQWSHLDLTPPTDQ